VEPKCKSDAKKARTKKRIPIETPKRLWTRSVVPDFKPSRKHESRNHETDELPERPFVLSSFCVFVIVRISFAGDRRCSTPA
jgi:hypothetical protein